MGGSVGKIVGQGLTPFGFVGSQISNGLGIGGSVGNFLNKPLLPSGVASQLGLDPNQPNSSPMSTTGPFSLNPYQVAGDTNAINQQGQQQFDASTALGQQQYKDLLSGIDTNSGAQQQYAADTLAKMTPGIEEGLNAQHLLNSTALQNTLGQQASYLAQDVASQNAQQKLAALQGLQGTQSGALQGLQGFQTGGLQRSLSLEDQINNANISKSIGAEFAPQAPTGKQNFGTGAQGVAALYPVAKGLSKAAMA